MTLDELLKLHPLPWRIVEDWPGFNVHDADGLPVDDTRPEAQAVCDAMSELVRLRESSMVQTHLRMAEKLEKAEAELATLRARNAELETFKARVASAFFAWSLPEQLGKGWNHDAVETIYKAIYGDGGAL